MNHQVPACPNPAVSHLPAHQQFVQTFVNRFNDDEQVWRHFKPRRAPRKNKRSRLAREIQRLPAALDALSYRKPADCIGLIVLSKS